MKEKLRLSKISIVVPDGSMQEVVLELLRNAGLKIVVGRKRTKEGTAGVKWIERIVFQRPQEIPQYLRSGHFDVAIVGEDWLANWNYKLPVLLKLPIGRGGNKSVKIVLAVNQASRFNKAKELPIGCEVATEYVRLVERFFVGIGRNDIKIIPSFGNTEHKIRFGATAIVDVTESGDSLRENQLRIIEEIMESNTVVVANPKSLADETRQPYIDYFTRLVKGAAQALQYIRLEANVPTNICKKAAKIIGGLKGANSSPVIGIKGWVTLWSYVPENKEQDIIFDLLQIGVSDIVVKRNIPLIMS